jgi:hypothetical protein
MNEFLAHAALIVFAATGTGVLIAGVAHYAVATDPHQRQDATQLRPPRRWRGRAE